MKIQYTKNVETKSAEIQKYKDKFKEMEQIVEELAS